MSPRSSVKAELSPKSPGAWPRWGWLLCAASIAAASFSANPLVAQEAAPAPAKSAAPAPASKQATTREQIDAWINQLSHDAYPVRQAAGEKLLDAGMDAREALLTIADGPDPETRAAARRLVALIDRTEFHRRLSAFAADVDGAQGLTLPGWERYRQLVGGDAAARTLFVDMQRQEGAMLSAVFGVSTQPSHEIWEQRMQRLVQWPGAAGNQSAAPPLGSCAAMLFLATGGEMEISDRGAMLVDLLLQRPPLREALQADNQRSTIRRLVASWILHCPNQSDLILQRRMSVASMHGISEALPLALAVAGGDPPYVRIQPQTRAGAIVLVGQLGKREHAERLEPLLEDATVCFPPSGAQAAGQAANTVQLRDVALVVMLHLTDQRPTDYGYVRARMQSPGLYQIPTLFVQNDQQRAEALAKWRAWKAEQQSRESRAESPEPEAPKNE